jgi:hypothetical protein
MIFEFGAARPLAVVVAEEFRSFFDGVGAQGPTVMEAGGAQDPEAAVTA